jgi:hypothetical protein
MTDTYKLLYSGQPAAAGTTLITVGTGKSQILKHIVCVNTDTSDRTIQFYRNGTNAAHKWGAPMLIKANDGFVEWDGTEAMGDGDTLYAVASVDTKITVTVTGDEVS